MNNNTGSFSFSRTLLSIALLTLSAHSYAGVLSGGQLNITYNNPSNLLAGLTLGPYAVTSLYVADFLNKSVADSTSVGSMASLADGVYPVPVTEVFAVNHNPLGSGVPTANSLGGRNNKPTTLSWASSQDHLNNSSTLTASGQIGFDGVEILKGDFPGFLADGDYSLKYSAARVVNGNDGWTLYNNVSFGAPVFDIRNLLVTTNNNALTMSGQLWWSAELTDFLFGGPGDASVQAGEAGTFFFTSATTTAVPEPISASLFASGLITLLGSRKIRRA